MLGRNATQPHEIAILEQFIVSSLIIVGIY